METALVLAAAYLIGSVDFGVIVPKLLGIDIYAVGSGNPGTSNVLRTMGKGPAALVLLGDGAKGALAAAAGSVVVGETVAFAASFAAVVGHSFPVWHRFRGGRGVATAIGAAVFLEPVVGVVLGVLWIGIVLIGKIASVASVVAMVLYVPGFALTGHRGAQLIWATAIALVVLFRHLPNIRRMARGGDQRVVSP